MSNTLGLFWWIFPLQGSDWIALRKLFQKKQSSVLFRPFLLLLIGILLAIFPGGSDGKSICLQCRRPRFDPWVGKISWGRKWQPTPVLLPGKFHGQRSLVGYSRWGCKESDTTEQRQCQCGSKANDL